MSVLEEIREEKVEWRRLGDVCEVGTGKSNTKEQNENGIYPFYVRSKDIKKSLTFQFDETAIIIPGEGGIGEIFHYVEGKYALHQRAYRIHVINSNLNTKYLYYYMSTLFKKYIIKNSVLSTVSSIRKPTIENFKIPIPSIETQTKIVEILDKLSYCTTELQASLKLELELRTKQYEYYRDMLLSEEFFAKKTRELCGQGAVELKTLGEIGTFTRGNGLQKKIL